MSGKFPPRIKYKSIFFINVYRIVTCKDSSMKTKYRIQVFCDVLYNNRMISTFHRGHQKSVCKCLTDSEERFHLQKVFYISEEIANND